MQNILVCEVRFSDAPIGDMDVKEKFHYDAATDAQIEDRWWDINRFNLTFNTRLISVTIQERGRYERPHYVGVFEKLE